MLRIIDVEGFESRQEFRRAIVTIAMGEEYRRVWFNLCRESWEIYGAKFQYDIIVITDYLDHSERSKRRSPAWQKLLILSQPWSKGYDRIVWVDADILISKFAYDVVESVPDSQNIGISNTDQISATDKEIYFERLYNVKVNPTSGKAVSISKELSDKDFLEFGIIANGCPEYNTGVLVATPSKHDEIFRSVYDNFDQTGRRYEQIPLSYCLHNSGMLSFISSRFNWNMHLAFYLGHIKIVNKTDFVDFLRSEFEKSYFLHFPGSFPIMSMLTDWKMNEGFIL
jgi:hypothetical protein